MNKTERVRLAREARRALAAYISSYQPDVSAYILNDLHQDPGAYRVRRLQEAFGAVQSLRDEEGWLP